ncbi:MAG: RES domain-containing protein [Candidatus Rokuibacteriota bacterium]
MAPVHEDIEVGLGRQADRRPRYDDKAWRGRKYDRRTHPCVDTGGRWNTVGTAIIYTGRTVGIAALEKFVHLAGVVPPDSVLVRVDFYR